MTSDMKHTLTPLALLSALLLASCGETKKEKEPNTPPEPQAAGAGSGLEAVLVTEAPADPVSVSAARQAPTPGTEIVVTGDIIGKPEVFVDNRAMFTIGDPEKITSCNRMPDDHCTTPWDVCCDDPEVIKSSIATVQVLDKDGNLIKQGLKGLGGMKELSIVVVKGTVAEGSSADNLLINADAIHVASVEPRK